MTSVASPPVGLKEIPRGDGISRELYDHVYFGRWNVAILRAGSHPAEARYVGAGGQTVLHLACLRDAPVDVISALLAAYPEATEKRDDDGCTPLHDACHRASDKVVRKLLLANVSVASMVEKQHLTPLQYLCTIWANLIRTTFERLLLSKENPTELLNRDWILARFWQKAILFVRAATAGDANSTPSRKRKQHSPFRMVHACASIQDCPPEIMRLAVGFCPQQLYEADEGGNLPLHIAAGSTVTLQSSPGCPWNLTLNGTETKSPSSIDARTGNVLGFSPSSLTSSSRRSFLNPIVYFIMRLPKAVSVTNHSGRLPLHVAIEHGKSWEHEIAHLLRAYPQAITMPILVPSCSSTSAICSGVTSCMNDDKGENKVIVFPFMSAATREEPCVQTIFELFRTCPELQRFGSALGEGNVGATAGASSIVDDLGELLD